MSTTATKPCTRCGSPDACATLVIEMAGERVEVRLCADCIDSFGRWIDRATIGATL
jgi:hypothetical protein